MTVWLSIILIILCLSIGIVWIMDTNRFVVTAYEKKSSLLTKNATVIMLSDLHNKTYGKENEKLIAAIRKENPDMIWIAGDMFTSHKEVDFTIAVALMQKLRQIAPVYYGNGNHEQKIKRNKEVYQNAFEEYKREIQGENLCLLENERVYLPEYNIDICGLEIDKIYFKRVKSVTMAENYIEELIGKKREGAFEVLLAHNPDYFENYAKWGADITVSGHVHGGVMRIPFLGGVISPAFRLFPQYDAGKFEKEGKTMMLGRGLGTHTIPIRIFNPGELVLIRLKAEQEEER